MKQVLTIIFSLMVISTMGQISDDFSDGDFTNTPSWSGTTWDFIVNPDFQLQLNSAIAGESVLSVPVNFTFNGNIEWKFYIKQGFAPSSSNFSKVYLSSDHSDLTQPLNGYFIRFGEALSNDAIELFRQDGSAETSVCRGIDGKIAGPFAAHIRVLRDSLANWKLFADFSGGSNFQIEASGTDSTYQNSNFAGVRCVYTSGNINKFYYDDFYFGPEVLDTVPPEITNVQATSDSTVLITFSEAVDDSTVLNLSNYFIDNGVGQPVSVINDSMQYLRYELKFINRFQGGRMNNLSVTGVMDRSQNQISPQVIQFIFTPIALVQVKDVIVSEVYFAPATSSPLPYAEYIEIYNRKDSAVEIRGWTISDGSTDGNIPAFTLGPGEYALLVDCDDSSLFSAFSNPHCIQSFPSLNNDGDDVKIFDSNGILIDELQFNTGIYGDNNKDDGGWSVERIDAGFTCKNTGNWKASASSLHGTPGSANSVQGIFIDHDSPFVTNAYLQDSLTLIVIFSEEISSNANEISNYRVTSQNSDQVPFLQGVVVFNDSAVLNFSSAFQAGAYVIQVSDSVHDCPGNALLTFQTKRFGYAQPALPGDLIVNELLFYCFDGGNDFVELYNNSERIIDLKDWTVTETDSSFTEIKEAAKIYSWHKLIFPGEYLVLSEDQKKIKSFYPLMDEHSYVNVLSMPDFSSDYGGVVINDNSGKRISAFAYDDEMHFPLIKETRGVSLERLSFNDEKNNWHSAAATAGFATPGYMNSQSIGYASRDGGFSLCSEIFSPNGDGYHDVLVLHYRCEQTGSVLSLNVFDFNGRKVRTVLNHQTINMEGDVFWDGLSDEGGELPVGIYIVLATSYDLKGNSQLFKKGVFLTRDSN